MATTITDIPIERWGKDHWGVFLYIEACCMNGLDGVGVPDHRRIQTNRERHPFMRHYPYAGMDHPDGSAIEIRLAGGERLDPGSCDEWDCIDDIEREGVLADIGPTLDPRYLLTPRGLAAAAAIRAHKAGGGLLSNFPTPALPSRECRVCDDAGAETYLTRIVAHDDATNGSPSPDHGGSLCMNLPTPRSWIRR